MPPADIDLVNLQVNPGARRILVGPGQNIVALRRIKLTSGANQQSPGELSLKIASLFNEVYMRICFNVRSMAPCHVLALSHSVNILEEDTIEVFATAVCYKLGPLKSSGGRFGGMSHSHNSAISFDGILLGSQFDRQVLTYRCTYINNGSALIHTSTLAP